LCQYAGSQVTAPRVRAQATAAAIIDRRPITRDVAPYHRPDHATAPPRAPPTSRS